MPDPVPLPPSERSSATSAWSDPGTGSGLSAGPDPPTVRSGSTARRAQTQAQTGSGLTPLPLPGPGERIDEFEVGESIGVGGMGAVLLALDTRLGRHVALKVLPPDQANDPEVVQRFYQEGRAAAQLDNENIARVFTIGYDGRFHYIAFEYIEGTTIRQRVEQSGGTLPVTEAINYTLQIAAALVHASERGVVHRDIKPSNVIVTPQGRAKLVDMGLARHFERGGDSGLTQSGMTLGTFDYISPEQARDPRNVDVRSDLYSLGCTLFHMLTGRPPFPDGTVLQKLIQHQEDAPPDVQTLNPGVPADLASVLVRLMAKDRDRRYQSPEQLVRDLLNVAGAHGLRSVSPEGLVWMAATRPASWERHLVWGIPAVAFALVLALLSVAGQEWGWGGPSYVPPAQPGKATPLPPRSRPVEPPRVIAAPAPAPAPAPIGPPGPTRLEPAPRELVTGSSADLLGVLASAPARSIIVLADNGPYTIGGAAGQPSRLARRDLTIRAAAGARPVIRSGRVPAEKAPTILFDFVAGSVTLEGLEFALDTDDRDDCAAIRTENTELTLRRCVFRHSGGWSRRGRVAALHLRTTAGAGARPAAVVADGCHFDPGQVGVRAQGPVDLLVRDCTIASGKSAFWFENPAAPTGVPVDLRLRHDSILAADGPVFLFEGTAPRVWVEDTVIAPARDSESVLVAIDDPDALDWRGRGNLFGRVGTFLQPIGARAGREAVRDLARWTEALATVRETGSTFANDRVWDEPDPSLALLHESQDPTRVFRLDAPPRDLVDVGARQGPFGALATAVKVAANQAPPRDRNPLAETAPIPTRVEPSAAPAPAPAAPGPSPGPVRPSDLPEMPVVGPTPRPEEPIVAETPPARPATATGPETESSLLRTVDQLVDALGQPKAKGGILRIAADVDWVVSRLPTRAGRWTLRAEPGASRPRIRFRPALDPKSPAPAAWTAMIDVREGSLHLEGLDVVLEQSDGPRTGRWAAFRVHEGAELGLTDCTVTVTGAGLRAVAIMVPRAEVPDGDPAAAGEPALAPATIRLSDSLARAGGDLIEVASGRRLDLELNNAVIATGASLVHAHGRAGGPIDDPTRLKLVLREVSARTAGGLVLLASAPGEPELPVAEVTASDSVLATTPQGDPLFRVDGQDALAALRDRIVWEGHGVAYHQINTYRRDQSAQVGAVPNLYDRSSWTVAVGPKEATPVHGDLKFLHDWDPDRDAWTLVPEDLRLAPASPAATAGANLERIPEPPKSAPG